MKTWLFPLPYDNTQNSNALVFTCCPNDADTVLESKHQDTQENPDIQCLWLKVNVRECQGAQEKGEDSFQVRGEDAEPAGSSCLPL